MDEESWRPVVGFEGYYEVSNLGRVRSLYCGRGHRGTALRRVPRILKPKREYRVRARDGARVHVADRYCLSREGAPIRGLQAGRLVLEAFVGPCPEGAECAHCDGDARNNHLTNLRWDTHVENLRDRDERHNTGATGSRQGSAKLTERDVVEVHRLRAEGFSVRMIAARFGVCTGTVAHILAGRNWSHLAGRYNITSRRNAGRRRPRTEAAPE